MAMLKANEPYFLSVFLTVSIMLMLTFVGVEDFHYLSIYDYSATDNTQYGEYDNKRAFPAQPFVYVKPDKKTEDNTSGHGES